MTINEKVQFVHQECNDVSSAAPENREPKRSLKNRFIDGETLKKIKTIAGPVRLLLGLMVYTVIGGLVFRALERPSELERLKSLRTSMYTGRKELVGRIINNTDVSNLASLIRYELHRYERVVQEAAQGGLLVSQFSAESEISRFGDETDSPFIATERWSIIQAVFFASTVLTTIEKLTKTHSLRQVSTLLGQICLISLYVQRFEEEGELHGPGIADYVSPVQDLGLPQAKNIIAGARTHVAPPTPSTMFCQTLKSYGNVVPSTNWGRGFCIIFAFGGIPLTLTAIADWGKLFAEAVSSIAARIRSKLPEAATSWLSSNNAGRRSLGAFAAAVLLFLYLACGAGMFMLWEEDWGFFDGFYFCFVTMTTIGFGDLVPKKPKYMLLCTMYILVGLALTGTIIELVRSRYAQSWRRLQALSGPLAETFRRLGEHAGGDMSAFHSDLRKVLTVVSMPRLRRTVSGRTEVNDNEWQEAVEAVLRDMASESSSSRPLKQPIMQIVIYESSV